MTRTDENLPAENSRVDRASGAVAATLGMWQTYDWRDEVRIDQLSAGDEVVVTTENHSYEIVVTSPLAGDVLVRGGRFFPECTPARLAGSSLGGSLLRTRSVNMGFRLEFATDGGRPVITSTVRTVRVIRVAADHVVM
jgi:hypothetical protein